MNNKLKQSISESLSKYPQTIASFGISAALILPGVYWSFGSIVSDKYDDMAVSGLTMTGFGLIQGVLSALRYKRERQLIKSNEFEDFREDENPKY